MAEHLVNEDVSLDPIQPLSSLKPSDSCILSNSNNDELQLLEAPHSIKNFDMNEDTTSTFIESTLPACVFRKYLKIVKNEEQALDRLRNDISAPIPTQFPLPMEVTDVYENFDNGSTANFLLKSGFKSEHSFNKTSTEILHIYFTNATNFEDVISRPMLPDVGKVLMCVNIALPVLSYVNDTYLLSTVIEDINSKKVVRVEVVCDLHEADLLALALKYPYLNKMEPGSIMLIHDPSFNVDSTGETLSICAKKMKDIAFLGHVDPSSIKRESTAHVENSNGSESNIRTDPNEDVEEEDKCGDKSKTSLWVPSSTCEEKYARDEWKELGNEYSVRRMHLQALIAYTTAQRFDPNSVELAAARIASLINLGMFSTAMKDVDSVINQDPLNAGLITRKAHCLWGLGKYNESIDYLKECLGQLLHLENYNSDDEVIRKSMFIQKIISKNEKIISQSQTPELWNTEAFFKNRTNVSYYEPEYYAPVSVICRSMDGDSSNYSSKTVVTNQPVPAGMLLVRTKAFSVVFQDCGEAVHDDELINLTMQKLLIENPQEINLVEFKEMSSRRNVELSKNAAMKFCEKYYYSSNYHTGKASRQNTATIESCRLSPGQTTIRGIWTFPANIRHACVGGNAVWYICGNIMFIRAICNIAAGEEVIMAHVDPTMSYEFRTQFLTQKEMICSCSLCQFEKTEPEVTKAKRHELLKDAHVGAFYDSSKEYNYCEVRRLKNRLEELEQMRSAYAKLNFPLVEPLYNFGFYLMKIENFDEAINAFEKAFDVVDNTAAIFTLVNLSFLLSFCYAAKKKNSDQRRSKKWFSAMKSYANLSYGCLHPITSKFKAEFEFLKRKGIAL